MSAEDKGQRHLTDEVLCLNELVMSLRNRMLDKFVKDKPIEESPTPKPPEPNPINYLITKTVETHQLARSCLELLEVEIISKLEGK